MPALAGENTYVVTPEHDVPVGKNPITTPTPARVTIPTAPIGISWAGKNQVLALLRFTLADQPSGS